MRAIPKSLNSQPPYTSLHLVCPLKLLKILDSEKQLKKPATQHPASTTLRSGKEVEG